MKKIILISLALSNICLRAQKEAILPNYYDYKIQLYAGANLSWYGPDRTIVGGELSYQCHNAGFNISRDIMYSSFFAPSKEDGYKKHIAYYGLRISGWLLSTSFNLGVGSTTYYHTTEEKILVPYYYWSSPSYTQTIYTVHAEKVPCLEFMIKSNLTRRANGIGLILSANINKKETFFDARVVAQLGYEWSWKKKKSIAN